jgi:hypothetical protein
MRLPPLYGLATDDSHNYFGDRGASPGRGWVMVQAQQLTAEALLDAIYDGNFYASSGVTLDSITWNETTAELEIRIAPQEGQQYTTEFIGTREGYDRRAEPVRDAEGKELPVTWSYSSELGCVLAQTTGPIATYRLKGDELYVRAVVTSSQAHANPAFPDQKQQAWTQPVGWQRRLRSAP